GQRRQRAFDVLTGNMLARRLNPLQPEASLVLAKPTGLVPHEGGLRFPAGGDEYRILRDWIAGGLRPDPPSTPVARRLLVGPTERYLVEPDAESKITVQAVFSDGKTRGVTHLACFESTHPDVSMRPDGTVRTRRPGETPL